MFKNYLKIAFRDLVIQKYYSLNNIFGLAFGIAASVSIFPWVSHELSFDKFHENNKNIYRITTDTSMAGQESNICYAPSSCRNKLAEICPEVLLSTRISPYFNRGYQYGDNFYNEKKEYYAMHKWLESFAFKTNISWWIFTPAGCLLALGIALLTVSGQSWRAARRNRVKALRYE